MKPAPWQRFTASARLLTPLAVTVFLVLVSVVPMPIPAYAPIAPGLPLAAVYYWSIYRPDLMTNAAVAFVGLLHDALTGTPLGVSILILLLVRGLVVAQPRFFLGKPFLDLWLCFVLVAAGASFAHWLLCAIILGAALAPWPGVFQFFMTFCTYPLLTWVLVAAQRTFLRPV